MSDNKDNKRKRSTSGPRSSKKKVAFTTETEANTEESVQISNAFISFQKLIESNPQFALTDTEALALLNKDDRTSFVYLNLPMVTLKAWQLSTVFKTRSQFFPVPEATFDSYTIETLKNWCFHEGKYMQCSHKGCSFIYKVHEKAWQDRVFYVSLYVSIHRSIPKSTSSNVLSGKSYNDSKIVFTVGNKSYFIYPSKGFVYYTVDDSKAGEIIIHDALLDKGDNYYPLFNRRTTPFGSDFPDKVEICRLGYFSFSFTETGQIKVTSPYQLCGDTRLSCNIFRRQFKYETQFIERNLKFGAYKLTKFKDSIYLNRSQTEKMLNMLIVLLGGIPLSDEYRPKTAEEDLSRTFYFLYDSSFSCDKLKRIYETVIWQKTIMECEFQFNCQFNCSEKREPKLFRLIEDKPAGEGDIKVRDLYGLRAANEYMAKVSKHLQVQQENYILVKPTGYNIKRFDSIMQNLIEYEVEVEDMTCRQITDNEFSRLYPNCLNRVYGPDWKCHMQSGPCVIIKTKNTHFSVIRSACIKMRLDSKLPWVKNVVHSAANEEERELMIELFSTDFNIDTNPKFSFISGGRYMQTV